MSFYESGWWEFALAIFGMPLHSVWVFDVLRRNAVPRSRQRYLLATIEWGAIVAGAPFPALLGAESVGHFSTGDSAGGVASVVAALAAAAILALFWRNLRRDGDDTWFGGVKKRLRAGARRIRERLAAGLSPSPAPVAV